MATESTTAALGAQFDGARAEACLKPRPGDAVPLPQGNASNWMIGTARMQSRAQRRSLRSAWNGPEELMSEATDGYALGYSETEARRLRLQADLFRDLTEDVLRRAGVARGMHVIDLGCGIGDVSALVGRDELLASIEHALEQSQDSSKVSARRERAAQHLADLTARQRQIMDLVLAGQPSKNIAADLGISQRTVENHRASIMRKTGSGSLPALARLVVTAASNGADVPSSQGE